MVHNTSGVVKQPLGPAEFMAKPEREEKPDSAARADDTFARFDSFASRMGINIAGEREARERIKREAEEAGIQPPGGEDSP